MRKKNHKYLSKIICGTSIWLLVSVTVCAEPIFDQQTGKLTNSTNIDFVCTGVDPDWNLTISKDLISLYLQKVQNLFIRPIKPVQPVGDKSGRILAYSIMTKDNKPVIILLKRSGLGCSNDSSGIKHQYDVYTVFADKVVFGCCDRKN